MAAHTMSWLSVPTCICSAWLIVAVILEASPIDLSCPQLLHHICPGLLPGTTVKVPTVDGKVDLKVPSGTQPGTTLVMSKRGVPRLGVSDSRGDHQVHPA